MSQLRFVGAAFPRTGTFSIKIAVEQLTGGTCYHFHEISKHPSHVPIWDAAYDGREPDWIELLSPFVGTLDGPACQHWKSITKAHPDLPVLLTVRNPDDWWDSVKETIYAVSQKPGQTDKPDLAMIQRTFFDGLLEGKFEDRSFATDVYRRYCDDVRSSVPSDRLFEYRVTDGWAPLCRMLDCEIPDSDFPKRNARAALRKRAGLDGT